jgi:SAM-dependent methyltransferase
MVDILALFDAAFWQSAWDDAIAADKNRDKAQKAVEVWNRRAKSYDKNVGTESGNRRVEEALAFLNTYGILQNKTRILDIGCGPGNFTVAFAELGHEVVAVDPAENMLAMLEDKLKRRPDLQRLVTIVKADWVPLALGTYGWESAFDLVFASMTPGVQDVATLQKAMKASKGFVYLSRFAGPRMQPSVEAIWEHFEDSPYYSRSLDILFPYNWLYTSGYKPALHYAHWERNHSQPVEEAVDEIKNILELRMNVNAQVEEVIHNYVSAQTGPDGLFSEAKGATSAMILWNINKKVTRLGG